MNAPLITPDAERGWVDRLPKRFQPFLRLMRADRPVGVWLLLIPCLWGILLARPNGTSADQIYILALLMGIGAFAMRSAGCVYNDIVDRKIDAKVARTAARPIPSGRVSVRQAAILLIALCVVGLSVLLQLGLPAILIGLLSLGLVAAYPFMKRITWWPQAWLGMTFNWGVLVGAAAISCQISFATMLLYGAGIFWTLGYDTIYAHQDREDDALIGVKSSARRLGKQSRFGVAVFYALAVILAGFALSLSGVKWGLAWLLPASAHFAWQIWRLDIDDGALCLMLFKSNIWAGWAIAIACLAA